jgi:hypothetical protein
LRRRRAGQNARASSAKLGLKASVKKIAEVLIQVILPVVIYR